MKKSRKRWLAAGLCLSMLLGAAPTASARTAEPVLTDLTVNYLTEPMALDPEDIRFGWKMQSNVIGAGQTAYEIVVSDGNTVVWDSGKVISDRSVAVPYGGAALEAENVYSWNVTVWDQDGHALETETSRFATDCDFSDADWVIPADAAGTHAVMLRKEAALKGQVRSAHLYVTSLGVYTAYLNGREVMQQADGRIMDDLFAPGWTDYTDYVNYQGYDVTDYVNGTDLCLGLELGRGWYGGDIGQFAHYETVIGSSDQRELAAIAKLVVCYEDGSRQEIVTDGSWTSSSAGPITFNDFYLGEHYDARLEAAVRGWNTVGFDDTGWTAVQKAENGPEDLRPSTKVSAYYDEAHALPVVSAYTYDPAAPVEGTVTENYLGAVVKTEADISAPIALKAGQTLILDMGVNTAAVMELSVEGEAGTAVTLRHAEILNNGYCNDKGTRVADGPAGTIYTGNLGDGTAVDQYILAGGEGTYRPSFTYHGYRYAEVTAAADIVIREAKSIPITSSVRQTGFLETSDDSVNQLIANALNSHRSNFTTLPTDCPQRRERLGWTGDIQLYSETAVYNYDSIAFLENYIEILNESAPRFDDVYGAVLPVYQDKWAEMLNCGWSDAGVLLPWVLYQQTGDTTVLETYYDSMDRYMQQVYTVGYDKAMFGDWYASCGTSVACMNAVYEYYVTGIMAQISGLVHKQDRAAAYERKQAELRNAYMEKFYNEAGDLLSASTPDGQSTTFHGDPVIDNAQSGLLWSLKLGLYRDEAHREYLVQKLVENIRNQGGSIRPNDEENTLSVGFLGINVLLPVLTQTGTSDVAYDLLMQDKSPSWLYAVKTGATSIWESWKAYDPEQGISSAGASFNHFSYGACLEWMYENMAGIQKDPEAPGFKNTILQPVVDQKNRLTQVSGAYESYYGTIRSAWQAADGRMTAYEAAVPANTTATLYLPMDAAGLRVETSGAAYAGVQTHNGEDCAVFRLDSGSYTFSLEDGVLTVRAADGYADTGVTVNLTGKAQATVEEPQLTYALSVTGAQKLATATVSFRLENLGAAEAAPAEGWYIISQSRKDDVLTVVLGNNAGVSSADAADLLYLTAQTTGAAGTAAVELTQAVLSAYTQDGEKFVKTVSGSTRVETAIDYSTYDVNQDGTVNQLDITRAQRAYGAGADDANWNALADVNGDGVVDINDLILILNNYSK